MYRGRPNQPPVPTSKDMGAGLQSNRICICLTSLRYVVVVCRLSAAAATAAPRPSSSLLLHPCVLSHGCRTGAWTEWTTRQRCTRLERMEQIGDGEETGGDSTTTGEDIFLGVALRVGGGVTCDPTAGIDGST
ncbi:hypothetical protein E2562_001832 [Oryza meyeriana var. granulata]|uniref:Uncharacterized protein n=1 Tax=Oryza meyeriana var. granulata TaxID=110450 RepID=A0A6G1CCH7_9ORYZ|nr:hypothetical protein E2562_001832 [Oryza meyeriana var. granulata]